METFNPDELSPALVLKLHQLFHLLGDDRKMEEGAGGQNKVGFGYLVVGTSNYMLRHKSLGDTEGKGRGISLSPSPWIHWKGALGVRTL